MKVFTTTLVKKEGKLDFNNDAIKKVYNQFVGVVPDGFTVNVIFELHVERLQCLPGTTLKISNYWLKRKQD